MTEIHDHRRVNDILLGPLERPTLKWLAAHMPVWVTPDTCTIVGVIGSILIAVSYVWSMYDRNFLWLASFALSSTGWETVSMAHWHATGGLSAQFMVFLSIIRSMPSVFP